VERFFTIKSFKNATEFRDNSRNSVRIKLARHSGGLIVGTPTHWGNMSAQLKVLFDRIVPALMGERSNGIPIPRHKGKPAVIVTACTTPWPFNFLFDQSSGAICAVKAVLDYGGYKILGKLVKPGTRQRPEISARLLAEAKKIGKKF
jgi:hypothetical protein